MTRATRIAVTRPRMTLALWAAATIALAVLGLGIQSRLSEGTYALPGTASARATVLDQLGFGTNNITPVMLTGPRGPLDAEARALVADLRRRWSVLSPLGGGRAASLLRPHRSDLIVLVSLRHGPDEHWVRELAPLRRAIAADVRAPVHAHVTGNIVGQGATNQAAVDSANVAERIAVPVLMLVLLLVFRSPLAAAIPALAGLATVAAAPGIIRLLAHLYGIAGPSVTFAGMMGLALGVDYSLLIVSRFREERYLNPELTPAQAAQRAAATAGRTAVLAGSVLTMAMALAAALAPGNVLVSITSGVIVAAVLSLLTGVTAVPAALSEFGGGIDRWRMGRPSVESGLLSTAARRAMARPGVVVTATLGVLLLLSVPALGIESAPPDFRQMPSDYTARRDYQAIRAAAGPGFVTPFEVVVRSDEHTLSRRSGRLLRRLETALAGTPGVVAVAGPSPGGRTDHGGGLNAPFFVARRDGAETVRLFVVPSQFAASSANVTLEHRLGHAVQALFAGTGLTAAVGGLGAEYVDYEHVMSRFIPLLIEVLSLLSFVLLSISLRAVLLPLLAVLLNLVVVGATFGALTLLFQGRAPLLGGPGFVDIVSIAAIFTILFGLSVDYEVFLLTRMREMYLAGHSAEQAVIRGVSRTGSVVTGAALVMTSVFVCFAVSGFVTPRQFGVGLAIAVLLDAFLLRMLLLPAAMRLLGAWSWSHPGWLEQILPQLSAGDGRA